MANTTSFKEGQGGRPAGVPNKVTQDLRAWITELIDENRDTLKNDFKALKPRDRLFLTEKLFRYIIPTLQATSLTTDLEKLSDEDLDRVINEILNAQQ